MFKKIIDSFKENLVNIVLSLIVVALALYGIDKLRENKRLHEGLIGESEKLIKLNDHIANLERKYVEQKQLLEIAKKDFGRQSEALRGRIKVLSNATYLIRERARKENRSDIVYEGKKIKYIFNEIRFNNGPPIGYVLIFDNGRVVSKIYNHEIDVKTAISRDEESGKYDILSRADFVLRSGHLKPDGKNWFGQPYPLKITGGVAHIDPTEPINLKKRFYFWAPKINANINASAIGISPGLGTSIVGYGYSKRDLDWKFLQFGAQYNKDRDIGLTFTPILYRPFDNLFSNTYIGPGISTDKDGQQYFFGVQVGF